MWQAQILCYVDGTINVLCRQKFSYCSLCIGVVNHDRQRWGIERKRCLPVKFPFTDSRLSEKAIEVETQDHICLCNYLLKSQVVKAVILPQKLYQCAVKAGSYGTVLDRKLTWQAL
jgi:hypothetical protein